MKVGVVVREFSLGVTWASFMQMEMPWAPRAPGLACTPSTDGVSISSTLTKTHHDTRPVPGGPSSFLVCTE